MDDETVRILTGHKEENRLLQQSIHHREQESQENLITNLNRERSRGLASMMRKKKEKEIIILETDKSK